MRARAPTREAIRASSLSVISIGRRDQGGSERISRWSRRPRKGDRLFARMASLVGARARIYVPGDTALARTDAIASEGSSIEVVDGNYDDAVARSSAELGPDDLLVTRHGGARERRHPEADDRGLRDDARRAQRAARAGRRLATRGHGGTGGCRCARGCSHPARSRREAPARRAARCGLPPRVRARGTAPVRARAAQIDDGRPELRYAVARRVACDAAPAWMPSRRSATLRPSRRCASWPPPASSPARPGRRDSPGCWRSANPTGARLGLTVDADVLVINTEGATAPDRLRGDHRSLAMTGECRRRSGHACRERGRRRARGEDALVAGGITGIEVTYSTPDVPHVLATVQRSAWRRDSAGRRHPARGTPGAGGRPMPALASCGRPASMTSSWPR